MGASNRPTEDPHSMKTTFCKSVENTAASVLRPSVRVTKPSRRSTKSCPSSWMVLCTIMCRLTQRKPRNFTKRLWEGSSLPKDVTPCSSACTGLNQKATSLSFKPNFSSFTTSLTTSWDMSPQLRGSKKTSFRWCRSRINYRRIARLEASLKTHYF